MNTEFFLAKRLAAGSRGKFSFTFVIIAITSIALGVAIMFVAVAILTAFKKEISEKVIGFHGHIVVSRFSESRTADPEPVDANAPFLATFKRHPDIRHVQGFATKMGIIKTSEHIQGVILKGIGEDYDWSFFEKKMKEGKPFHVRDTVRNDSVVISRKLSEMLGLNLNEPVRLYFLSGDRAIGRKFTISGIYDTGLEEFDKLYVIGDIHHLQRLNNWGTNKVEGYEVFLKKFRDLDRMGAEVYRLAGFEMDAATVRMNFQQIFDWLDLQDINVIIILFLVILVSATTIVSTLLILILERTSMIGILKSLGMNNQGIRKIFLFHGMYITGWGILYGNAAGFLLCLIQMKFGVIKLSEESYYMSVIPVNLDILNILLINTGTLLLCYLIFLIPSMVISRISPLKAIRMT